MLKKSFVIGVSLLLVVVVGLSFFSPVTQAQQDSGDDVLPGETNFVFINYIGQDLYLDLDDVQYVIPGTATAPEGGRLTLQLSQGEHKFAANVPGLPLGTAGEFTIEPGGYAAKAAVIDRTPPKVENGILIEKPRDFVNVFDFDPFAAPAGEADQPVVDTWRPAPASPGLGSLVWINHNGTDELTVDLAGQLYKVPPTVNGIPGRLQIDVAPGFYRYSATTPNGGLNGEVVVVAGQVIGLSVIPEIVEEIEYDVGDDFNFLPEIRLKLNQEYLTSQAVAGPPETTAAPVTEDSLVGQEREEQPVLVPTTGETIQPETVVTGPQADGLLIKNFTGDALVFTINYEVHTIPPQSEAVIQLPPGEYNYTASLPFVARNGTATLAAGETIALSVATNIAGDVLNVYQN